MSAPKLPPITRGANSTIPDYEAHVGILFDEMVKINDKLGRAKKILAENPMKKPEIKVDERDFQTMSLLLPEGGDPSWEKQILQMRDDFYSGDPARKKPWLDIVYDRYDNVDVGKLDPSKPEEARMLLESTALAQTFPVKLNENYEYKTERYKTVQKQNVLEQRNEYSLPFESMAQIAVAKAYDENGNKISADDPLPDIVTAKELKIRSAHSCYKMDTSMSTFSADQDSRFFYPAAQRTFAEYQMHKTGTVQPLHFTLPQEFSKFAEINIDEIKPNEITSGPLSRMANSYVGKMFHGRDNLNAESSYPKRVFINGKSVAEIVNEKFPGLPSNEQADMSAIVIATAMASGKDKISTVFAVKDEKGLYQAYPIDVTSDLSAVYASPQALEEAKQRQAQANGRELTKQEEESFAHSLKEANRGIFDFSAKSKKIEFEEQYLLDGSATKEAEAMKEFSRRLGEQGAKDKLFIKNGISEMKLPFHIENGVAAPMEYHVDPTFIPNSYCGRSIDKLTLENCATKDYDKLAATVRKFNVEGMSGLDVVLIDGKSVSAQVKERYPEVTNPVDRQRLGTTMLGIALSNGQHRLTTISPLNTTVPGVLQLQEKPIHLDVAAMYPKKEEEFSAFRLKYFDWGLFKCHTKGELAQKRYDKLIAKPLTGVEKDSKEVTIETLNQKIIKNTCEKALKDYHSPEQDNIKKEKMAAIKKFNVEKQTVIKDKLEAWTKAVLAPEQPKKEVQASVEKAISMDKIDKEMQVQPKAKVPMQR